MGWLFLFCDDRIDRVVVWSALVSGLVVTPHVEGVKQIKKVDRSFIRGGVSAGYPFEPSHA